MSASPANGAEARSEVRRRSFHCTDMGNAERFAALHVDRARFCHAFGRWLVWDDTRWAIDVRGEVMQLAKQVVRSIYAEASRCGDDDMRKALGAWARKSEARNALQAMVALAQSEPALVVTPDQLDRDPWLLNTPTGTIDLRTGICREHRRTDLLTKRTAASFIEGARSDLFERVVREAMNDNDDLVSFFQRAVGYSMTGDTREEKLFIVHGRGGTSKSTIVQAIIATLGDYARTADFEAFLQRKNTGAANPEIARLAGIRFVASIEVDKGKKLAQGLMKTLTGGDVVTARALYQEAIEFTPTFHLWLVANDAPVVPDDDTGLWRRILFVPLDRVVEKKDPAVKEQLRDVDRSGPAILAWLVVGCLQWQAKGLDEPSIVTDATRAYREEQDPLRDFLTECCVIDPAASCSRTELRAAYNQWAEEAGGRVPLTGQDLNARIRRVAGVSEVKLHGARRWKGIAILTEARPRKHHGAVDPRTGDAS